MARDAEHNADRTQIDTPILYVRGDADGRSPEDYLPSFQAAGATNIRGAVIPGGEYVAEEQPELLIDELTRFRASVNMNSTS